jgi:hypothetical protein
MLQIYEHLYEKECHAYKTSLWYKPGDRDLPKGKVSFATVMYDFLHNLHIRRVSFPVNKKQKKNLDQMDLGYIALRLE